MLDTVRPHIYDAQFGPFYKSRTVTDLLGCSRQALSDRAARGTVLRTKTADGKDLYPTFRFAGGGAIDPAVRALLKPFQPALAGGAIDGWAVAYWITTPHPDLDGLTPLDWIHAGNPSAEAVEQATRAVTAWTAP
jgi:hypothetical protein